MRRAAAASEGEKGSLSLPFGLTSLEELSSLYQGLPGALLKEGPPSALYLGVYEAMKARLRDEYVGLGGTPSKPMPSNLFLNIILGISALAVLCKLGGIL